MDKRTILAFVLIGVVIVGWSMFFAPTPEEQTASRRDTAAKTAPAPATPAAPTAPAAIPPAQRLPEQYAPLIATSSKLVTVETPTYTAVLNTRGGLLARFTLKNYKTWYGAPVQLIADSSGFPGVLGLDFTDAAGKEITTGDLQFTIDGPEKITLGANDSAVVTARLAIPSSPSDSTGTARTIEKRFVFHGSNYGIGFSVAMTGMEGQIAGGNYTLRWTGGMKYQEHNSVDESSRAKAHAKVNDELHNLDQTETGKGSSTDYSGSVEWVGTHVKYFGSALIPATPISGANVRLTGFAFPVDSNGLVETYAWALRVPFKANAPSQQFTLFVGPLQYDALKQYGVSDMLDFGWAPIRPIGEYLLLPMFRFLHSFIPNYGFVIIIFSILIRLALWPLSVPQIRSARKMQLLKPVMDDLRQKYKGDPQRQQMETMNLYREYGINPMGGCLPMLLQLPILYALYATLSNAIDLRQAGFMLWIHDLSIPDAILHLPFSLPLLGNAISGMALIMGVSMFFQNKMLITDPQQKMMIYLMPVLLTLTFNFLPSGLNLYYLTFNVLAIGQQVWMTKYSKTSMTLETLRREASQKKKGWLSQKMEEAQRMAEMQRNGQSAGPRKVDGRTPVEPKKKK